MCIRRSGGCNNNPTVRQFTAALKKLHAHVNINILFNSNCIPRDDTIVLKMNDDKDCSNKTDSSTKDMIWNMEHDYDVQSVIFNEYQDDILAYIAGFVAKQTVKKNKLSVMY